MQCIHSQSVGKMQIEYWGSNIPIILSICQTPNCFLILRFNSSPSSISFWSQRTFLPQNAHHNWTETSSSPPYNRVDVLIHFQKPSADAVRTHTLKIDRFDVKIPTLIIRVFFVGQKQFVAVDWKLWQRLLQKLTQEMLDNCGCSMHTTAKKDKKWMFTSVCLTADLAGHHIKYG